MKMLKNDGGQTQKQLSSPSCCTSCLSSSSSLLSNRAKILFVIGLNLVRSLWNPPSHTDSLPPPPLPQDMKLSSSHLHLLLIAIYSAVSQSFSKPQTAIEQKLEKEDQRQEKSVLLQFPASPEFPESSENKAASTRFHEYPVSFDIENGNALKISRDRHRHRRDTDQNTTTTETSTETDVNSTWPMTVTLKLRNETNDNNNQSTSTAPTPTLTNSSSRAVNPPFECSQLDELFPVTLPDGTKDDECVYAAEMCGKGPYMGKQLFGEPCAPSGDLMSILKRLPLGTSNREKNLLAQSLTCNKSKSLYCYLVPEGKLTVDKKRETLFQCGCDRKVGQNSYSEKTGKCYIPFGESVTEPCDMAAEEEARNDQKQNHTTKKPKQNNRIQHPVRRRPIWIRDPEKDILLCQEDLECSRKSISKSGQGEDELRDYHCYCPEGKELSEKTVNRTQRCVKLERAVWKKYFQTIVGIVLSIVSFSIIFGGILHVELSDPRPGITSRGFRRKPSKLLTTVASINLNQMDLSVASDDSKLLLTQDQPSDV